MDLGRQQAMDTDHKVIQKKFTGNLEQNATKKLFLIFSEITPKVL